MKGIVIGLVMATVLTAQDVDLRLYSEFQRIRPDGSIVEADRAESPQEIISPPLIRNGFTTFHVAVTGRPRILYWLAIQTNPADIFRVRVYREQFLSTGTPDVLIEEPKPYFFLGVMPDLPVERVTQAFLIDIWTPPDAPVNRVRFEVLVKTGEWVVAPMEVRVLTARVPDSPERACCSDPPGPERPADTAAWFPLWNVLSGFAPPRSAPPGTIRYIILRNALQDAAVARTLDANSKAGLLNRVWAMMSARLLPGPVSLRGDAESYLGIRRRIWNLADNLATGAGNPVQ